MKEGDLIPNITLRSVDSDGIQNFNLVEHFQNKKVLVICVPLESTERRVILGIKSPSFMIEKSFLRFCNKFAQLFVGH